MILHMKMRKEREQRDMLSDFYKNEQGDQIYWIDNMDTIGEFLFSFDKKKIYNFFRDYPHALSKEEKALFDKENPELAKLK